MWRESSGLGFRMYQRHKIWWVGLLHTRDCKPVTIVTLQALSLVENTEPVQVRYFTLCLRDQRSEYVNARWMSSLHGFLHGIKWIMSHGHLDYLQKLPLGGRPNTKPRDYGTLNAHKRWFILLYRVWGPAWIEIHWKRIWLRAQSHMTFGYIWTNA